MQNEIVKSTNQPVQFNFMDAEQFATIQRVSTMYASSELVPEMYRISENNPREKAVANCMLAIEMANRIGASTLMVMQNMYIVQGRPAWSAKFLTATVNGCGRFNSIKYRFEKLGSTKGITYTDYEWKNENGKNKRVAVTKTFNEDLENWQCIAFTTEKGSDEILESIPVSLEMAIKEGWYTKDGSKWKTMAKLMLQYRAATFWTRAYAPELSMGMRTAEEIEDIDYEDISAMVAKEIKANANKESIGFDQAELKPEDVKNGNGKKKTEKSEVGKTERSVPTVEPVTPPPAPATAQTAIPTAQPKIEAPDF